MEVKPSYPYLVKNLRGIVYFSEKVNAEKELEWLKKKFRYRDLGVSETLKLKEKWKRLITLSRIDENPAIDSAFQASLFLCPLIILKEKSLRDFEKGIVAKLKTSQKLSDRELKFNLRLVNYSITDFYLKAIELGKRHDLERRKELAEKDLKRFWRIGESKEGKVLIAYIDPLLLKEVKDELLMSLIPALVLDLKKA